MFIPLFIIFWPTYTIVMWWFFYERTFDELLGLLAHFGTIMGGTGIIVTSALHGWVLAQVYNFL